MLRTLINRLYLAVVGQQTGSGWRIPALDGVRGVAALLVLAAHTRHASLTEQDSLLWSPIERGGAGGVVLFFALSGFLLYLPWLKSEVEGGAPPRLRTYAIRRCLRIMPAYYASVVAFAVLRVVVGGREPIGFWPLALHAMFLPTLSMPLQTVYWTLQVEEFFYWLLPLMHRLVLGIRAVGVVLLACAVSVVWAAIGWYAMPRPHLALWLEQTPFFLPVFALGIYTAVRWSEHRTSVHATKLVLGGLLGYVLLAPLAAYIALRSDHVATPVMEVMMAPAAAAVVLGAARGGAPLLEHPLLRFLGGISFSIYLWHMAVIRLVPVPAAIVHAFLPRLVYTLVISVAVALIAFLVVERPFLALRPTDRAR